MWQKLFQYRWLAALWAALPLIFAYAPFDLNLLGFLLPPILIGLAFRCRNFKEGFKFGFLHSTWLMIGGFYWIVYVIHVFGYLPWAVSALLFVGFCGIAAINLPLFLGTLAWIHERIRARTKVSATWGSLWYAIGIPALFTVCEYCVPKIFPWHVGDCLYKVPVLIQISEITGALFLGFAMFSLGSVAAAALDGERAPFPMRKWAWAIPGTLWLIILLFGVQRLGRPGYDKELRIALIQANIGSLEKVEAQTGVFAKVRYVIDRYYALTEQALAKSPKPELIIWPETALPFQVEGRSRFAAEVRKRVADWGVPLITGGYAQSPYHSDRDFNAAFLIEPTPDSPAAWPVRISMGPKNILLAFGEYFPGGDRFPKLYKWFPQVSNFELGRYQTVFKLKGGERLGLTICYEAIVAPFVRKVVLQGSHALINLTNDSWFGPTSEPYQHGQLAVFRSVETRQPLIRVTNTGTSFTVDEWGHLSEMTPVYQEAVLQATVRLPKEPVFTFYSVYGDWLILTLLGMLLALLLIPFLKKNASLPI